MKRKTKMNVGESPSDNSQGYQHFLLCKSKFNIDKCTRGGILSFLLLPLPPCLHLAGPPPLLTGRRTIDLGGPQAGPPSLSPLNQNRSFSFASRCRIRDSAFCKRRCMGKRIDGFGAACEWRGFFFFFFFFLCPMSVLLPVSDLFRINFSSSSGWDFVLSGCCPFP